MKKLLLTSCLALGLTSGLFAASINPQGLLGGAASGGITLLTFDSDTIGVLPASPSGLTITGSGDAQVVFGSEGGQYAAPFLSGNNNFGFGPLYDGVNTTNYLSTGTGSITFAFDSLQNYFGLLWGSVDDYNSLAFYNGDTLLGTVWGSNEWFSSTDGNQGQNGTFYVNIYAEGVYFNKVVASSSQYAFEIDNIAYGSLSVPDSGATVALLGLSLACLVFFRRKS